ncbi:MAG: radical SAM protein [Phycisphaerae bacterium]
MKCIAAVEVDFDESPLGTRSRAADDLNGQPVLTRTLTQIARADRIAHLFVICPPHQSSRCRELIGSELSARVTVRTKRIDDQRFGPLVRTARKWSLDGWRGGIGGICSMDEYTRSDELALLAHGESADLLFCASASAPLIDPALADTMIDHAEQTAHESRITFAQAPPGLAGTVYKTELLIEMGQQHIPPGMVLSYKPDAPMMDLAHKTCCYTAPAPVRHAVGRLIVDTERAFQTVQRYLSTGLPIEAESVSRWLIDTAREGIPELPREVEIELTTEDQLADTILRPRGPRVGSRGPIEPGIVQKIADELAAFDDSLVVLGGFGEPLLHPRFDDILNVFASAGIYGVAVRTNGLALDDDRIDAVIRHGVDVVSALFDAWTPATYRTVHGQDRLNEAVEKVRRLVQVRGQRRSVAPLVVPEITKSLETMHELDSFFDGWVREMGWANIVGYSDYAGQMEDRRAAIMAPPTRHACRRISQRATVLADGRLLLCDQDFTGKHAVGSLKHATLGELWTGHHMQGVRKRHRQGCFDSIPLCANCEQWHRP